MMKSSKLVAVMLALVALCITSVSALADTLVLKDGTAYEGYVKSEGDDYVFFVVQQGSYTAPPKMFMKLDIKELRRDTDDAETATTPTSARTETPAMNEAPAKAPRKAKSAADIPAGAVKIAFLTLGDQNAGKDMVGPYINGDAIEESADVLRNLDDAHKPDIVVLTIDSGGGAVAAIEGIMDSLDDMKQDFRVVAWIKSAISGAAFTAMNFEEIYFMTSGHLGGNVMFSMTGPGQAKAGTGKGLAYILEVGERVSRAGRLDPAIMKAMQIFGELTADIDENGNVKWYWYDQDDERLKDDDRPRGKFLVSPENMILTFNSVDAERYAVSKGTADTKDLLATLMGVTEWVEVGQEAEAHMVDFRDKTKRAEERLNVELNKFSIALAYAKNARTEQERGKQVSRARRHLRAMQNMVRDVKWWFELNGYDDDWFRERERELDDIARGG